MEIDKGLHHFIHTGKVIIQNSTVNLGHLKIESAALNLGQVEVAKLSRELHVCVCQIVTSPSILNNKLEVDYFLTNSCFI